MNDKCAAVGDANCALEVFAAELTAAVYAVALRHGLGHQWLELELELWRVLIETVKKRGAGNDRESWMTRRCLISPVNESEVLMSSSAKEWFSTLVLGCCLGLIGARPPVESPAPAPVTVSYPVERDVTDYADYTARTAAVDSVDVRAHVWGYLDKVNFKEGAMVKKGDVLFELDPRPYEALLNQAKAKVAQDEAQLKFDDAEYQRQCKSSFAPAACRGPTWTRVRQRAASISPTSRGRQGGGRVAPAGCGVHQGHRSGQWARQPLRRHDR